ncbi:MAG: hypothetical protein AAGD96_32060, partial [Chloroflexota bacterium]
YAQPLPLKLRVTLNLKNLLDNATLPKIHLVQPYRQVLFSQEAYPDQKFHRQTDHHQRISH